MPEITVVIPVYNVKCFLNRCIDSVLNQTYTDFEVLLIDDGSSDGSEDICDEYVIKDKRIHVIHQANCGQAAARNRAVECASGEWICFVDSDDLIHSQMLELLYNAVKRENANIGMCGIIEAEKLTNDFFSPVEFYSETTEVNEEWLKKIYENGEHRYWCVCGKLIRKKIIDGLPFTEGRIYEDNAIVCQWLKTAQKVVNTQAKLYFYQVNLSGTTKSKFNIKHLDYLWALEMQLSFYQRIEYPQMYHLINVRYAIDAAQLYKKVRYELKDKKRAQSLKKILIRAVREEALSKQQRRHIYSSLFPKVASIYWYCKRVFAAFHK